MNAITIDTARLAKIKTLKAGGHNSFSQGACILEAVSYIAREPWSDHPECACPVIAAFLRNWNDNLPDDERTALLLPLITKVAGTRGSAALANRRATMATDWLIRVQTPAWLRLAGLVKQAEALEAFPEIVDFAKTPSIRPTLEAIRQDAAAAWDAAGDAAWAAAGDALKPTKIALQVSAVALVERMCALTDADLEMAA